MNINGPIIIIEDDPEEVMILQELIQGITARHGVVTLDSRNAIDYLSCCEKPFLILSGINLRGLNGFQLRDLILQDKVLARKCGPYIFYAAHSNHEILKKVYDLQASGFLHDINDYSLLESKLTQVIHYWEQCAV